ncbi:hypothetical protein [Bradyrhizobium sp. STM 3562]|uniref:hypothetical protein n=1 Tax=Bradyrhizobium sp. STM 3562 TaxID=578924 RepID=UPI003890CE48
MGVGPHAIQLTRIIQEKGFLAKGFSVLELGSQDFAPTPAEARSAIRREFALDRSSISTPGDFYRAIGCERYECIDLDGKHGAKTFDLNFDIREKYAFDDQFDLVTNHGTTEHLLNQHTAFLNVHNLTAPDGVMLHGLPFQGYQNHGMFNYNPSFFLDLATANGYEILGLYLSINDALYPYSEEFLAAYDVRCSEDVLVMAALRKQSNTAFKTPYDGRYFTLHGKDKISARDEVGSSIRFRDRGAGEETSSPDHESPSSPTQRADRYSRPYTFITPVWGEPYVDTYVHVTLPSQLSEGNLGAFASGEVEYVIVTTAHDERRIRSSDAFAKLQKIASVSFIRHQAINGETSYQRQTRAANLALRRIVKETAAFFLTADDFFADGLFGYARKRLSEGARAVIVPTLRATQAGFNAYLQASGVSSLKPRELVRAIMQHEHPLLTSVVINCPSRVWHELPSQTLVRLKDGYVGRWNVMHPLAVKVAPPVADIESTWDWNYPALVARNADDIEIIRDSDCGFICSPTEMNYSQDYPILRGATRRIRIRTLIEWISINWGLNFHLLQTSDYVRLHAGDIGPEWKAAEVELDKVCGPYIAFVKKRAARQPENLRNSNVDLLSRPFAGTQRFILWRRAARISIRSARSSVKNRILTLLRRVARRIARG